MSKHLLYLISDLHVGGACSLMINNAVELKKKGFDVDIVYFGPNEAMMPRIREHGLSITRLAYSGGVLQFFRVTRQLVHFIRKSNIDVIHGNLHLDIRFGVLASVFTGK